MIIHKQDFFLLLWGKTTSSNGINVIFCGDIIIFDSEEVASSFPSQRGHSVCIVVYLCSDIQGIVFGIFRPFEGYAFHSVLSL